MKCLDRFNKKMQLTGKSLREERIYNSKKLLDETFDDESALAIGIYFWILGVKSYDDKETVRVRFQDRKFSNANGTTMQFQSLYDTPIIVGDILYDSISDEYWICTESFNINTIHWQGKLTLCNWILKWQNKYGTILEYPCYEINATQYNSGEQSNKQFTIGSSQHMITLPCDENTVILSSPQRFFLDKNKINPTSFIVTQNDSTSYNYGKKGLVKLTVFEHANNPTTDRFDLGICDYIEVDTNINSDINDGVENTIKSVIDYESLIIKSGGDLKTFTAKFYDNNGVLDNIIPKWEIISDFNNYLEVEYFDNSIKIGIDNDDLVDEEFKLILSDNEGHYSSALIIKIDSLL